MLKKIKLDRAEKWAAIISALGLFAFLFLIYDDSIVDRFFPTEEADQSQPVVGYVTLVENDIRYKNSASLQWTKSTVNQEIRQGDSIFNGSNSTSEIKLNKGDSISLGENTLLQFNEVDGVSMPVLSGGNFNLKVNGNLKVTINGEMAEFTGQNSKIQVVVKKHQKPKILLLNGDAKVRTNFMAPQQLKINDVVKVDVPEVVEQEYVFKPVELPPPPHEFNPHSLGSYTYYLKLYDLYKKNSEYSFRRLENVSLNFVPIAIELSWTPQGQQKKYSVQIAKDPDFSAITAEQTTSDARLTTKKMSLGKNYWRVSSNQMTWSKPLEVEVQSNFIQIKPPALQLLDPQPKLIGGNALIGLQLQTQHYFKGFLLEISLNREFPTAQTTVHWVSKRQLTWRLNSTEKTYFRVRGITDELEITDYSNVQSAAPIIPIVIAKKAPIQPRVKIDEQKVAELKEISEKVEKKIERIPATTEESTIASHLDVPNTFNDGFTQSRIALLGAASTMFSATQIGQNSQAPITLLGGVQVMHWFSQSGLDFILKTKVAGLNAAAAPGSPFITDIKYKYRWFGSFNPFSSRKKMQGYLSAGYEVYKNSGATSFAQSYSLYKAGFGLDFPFFKTMDTGGEVLYGTNGSSKKIEISGYMGYYLKKSMSVGAGYRINTFEAGTTKDSPNAILPYREAYGEGYSTFRWNY